MYCGVVWCIKQKRPGLVSGVLADITQHINMWHNGSVVTQCNTSQRFRGPFSIENKTMQIIPIYPDHMHIYIASIITAYLASTLPNEGKIFGGTTHLLLKNSIHTHRYMGQNDCTIPTYLKV